MRWLGVGVCTLAVLLLGAAPAHAAYGFVDEWGIAGTADGEFTDLRDVASDGAGNVFTAEAGRIQKFGPSRTFLAKAEATGGQSFQSLTVAGSGSSGIVYAVDRNNGILRYRASDLAPLGALPLGSDPATANFAKPRSVSLDTFGNLIVTFTDDLGEVGKDSGVALYQSTGAFVRTIGAFDSAGTDDSRYTLPLEAEESGGVVWVLDSGKRWMQRYNRNDGSHIGRSAFSPSSSWDPRSMAIMPGDPLLGGTHPYTVFTYDGIGSGNQQLKVWRNTGVFHYWFGTKGTGEGKYMTIAGMDADAGQRLFVADSAQSKVIEYGTGGTPGPGDPVDPPPDPPPTPTPTPSGGGGTGSSFDQNAQPIICIGLWSAATCSGLPPPNPVYVCVSYWENCNGFGGSKPAKPGTIDLSGFPSSLGAAAECAEDATTPFARRATPTGREDEKCILGTYLESEFNATEITERDLEVAYANNSRTFRAEVGAAYAQSVQSLDLIARRLAATDDVLEGNPQDPELARHFARIAEGLRNSLGPNLDGIFDAAITPGVPVKVTDAGLADSAIETLCAPIGDEADRNQCVQALRAINFQVTTGLTLLQTRKRELGLDRPLSELKAKLRKLKDKANAEKGGKMRAKGGPGRFRFVLGSGEAVVPQGERANLKIRFPRPVLAQLRKMRNRGLDSFKASAVVYGGIAVGVETRERERVRVKLSK